MINDIALQAEQIQQYGQTLRFHTEVVIRTQDVAQHSFNVALLCDLLLDGKASRELLLTALMHDAGERKTGDMPAPTKRGLGCSGEMDDLEAAHLLASSGYMEPTLTSLESSVLKAADSLDGAFYCLRELKLGNKLVLDTRCGGAARNFMMYVRERRATVPDEGVRAKIAQLYDFLEGEFSEYSR